MPEEKEPQGPPADAAGENAVDFHYIKSAFFRVIHVDGVVGGVSPHGLVQMAVFSDRLPIPQQTRQRLHGSQLGDEILEDRVSRSGVVREVESELLFDVDIARSIVDWLKYKIKDIERLRAAEPSRKTEQAK